MMLELLENPHVRYNIAGLSIALAIFLQFIPLYKKKLDELAIKHPLIKIVQSRAFQLVAGFVLLTVGIEVMRLDQ